MSKRTKTDVISFRLPREMAQRVDEQAKINGQLRAEYVKEIFLPAFRRRAKRPKPAVAESV